MDRPDPIVPPEPYRRLTLLDLTVLMFALGSGGWAWLRYNTEFSAVEWPLDLPHWLSLETALSLALAGGVGLAGLRRFRVERHEPGYLTAIAMGIGLACYLAQVFAYAFIHGYFSRAEGMLNFLGEIDFDETSILPVTVAVTWLILGLSGNWKRAGGLLDHVGLAAGGLALVRFAALPVWEYLIRP